MLDVVQNMRVPTPTKPSFPKKRKNTRPSQKEWIGKGQLDHETRRDIRRRKLCFTRQNPWATRHQCTKGKAHYIEVFSDSDPE